MSKQVHAFNYTLTLNISEDIEVTCDLPVYADDLAKQHFLERVLNIDGSTIPSNFEDFIQITSKEQTHPPVLKRIK